MKGWAVWHFTLFLDGISFMINTDYLKMYGKV